MGYSLAYSPTSMLFRTARFGLFLAAAAAATTVFHPADSGAADKKLLLKTPVAFNTQLPVLGDTVPWFADMLKKVSGGKIRVKIYEPGKLVPAFQIHEAVSTGKPLVRNPG